MRLIDADALDNRILTTTYTEKNFWALNLLSGYVKEAPTIGGWISVKDRLPEKNGRYLVCENGEVYSAEYEKNRPVSEWTDDYEGYLDMMVSHWMPLPSTEGLDET